MDLSLNRLTGSIPANWDAPKLVELDLHGNALSSGVPASLAALPRLSYLQLQVRTQYCNSGGECANCMQCPGKGAPLHSGSQATFCVELHMHLSQSPLTTEGCITCNVRR